MNGPPDRVVTMDPCPSTNRLWIRAPGKPRVRSPEYRAWIQRAGWQVRAQLVGAVAIDCRFDCLIEVPVSRRDTDNWAKATLDLCQTVGVVTNDGNANTVTVRPVERSDVMVALWALPAMGGVRRPAAPRGAGARREAQRELAIGRTLTRLRPGLTWLPPGPRPPRGAA